MNETTTTAAATQSTIEALYAALRSGDESARNPLVDALMEAGRDDEAAEARTLQVTEEGAEVVTVARDGANTANCGNGISRPIYCTAIYRAERRHRDGRLTWRRVGSFRDGTAGIAITDPMVGRAKARAAERGVPFVAGVRHGTVCR